MRLTPPDGGEIPPFSKYLATMPAIFLFLPETGDLCAKTGGTALRTGEFARGFLRNFLPNRL